MALRMNSNESKRYCKIPRRKEAEQALIMLAWKKRKSTRPEWLTEELETLEETAK